jgi:hypothetical protein
MSVNGTKQTSNRRPLMSAFDPKRTKADVVGLSAMYPNSCRQLGLLDQLVGARDELQKRLYLICINDVLGHC